MRDRLLSLAFSVGILAFAALVVLGVVHSVQTHGRLPGVHINYAESLNALFAAEDWEGLTQQLRASARLDLGEEGVVREILPNLIRVARKTGDRDSELFAWRRLAELRRSSPGVQLQLARALAAPGASDSELGEAAFHARLALELAPESSEARTLLAELEARGGAS